MIGLQFERSAADAFTVLCLGAHADDIEIGCGGTILQLKKRYPKIKFHWVVFAAYGERMKEAQRAAQLFTAGCETTTYIKEFRDGFLPYNAVAVKEFFEQLKSKVNPDLILTHWQGDAHQDHRLVCELTWNTFRNHCILEYEIPKYDGDLGRPNVFVPVTKAMCEEKVSHLMEAYVTQRSKHWFDEQLFLGLMRVRGMEANATDRCAEAFYARKLSMGWGA